MTAWQGRSPITPIGYIATSLRRTRGTALLWKKIKLLPPTPFATNPDRHRAKRRLYPEPYVSELARITERHYRGARLEREHWRSFQEDVYAAYNRLVMPLLGDCFPPVEIELDSGQGAGRSPIRNRFVEGGGTA